MTNEPTPCTICGELTTEADALCYDCTGGRRIEQPATVKRPDLFGTVHDTHATEAELNGYQPEQGRMF